MITKEFVIIAIAMAIVALDILVRLVISPGRKDAWLRHLLGISSVPAAKKARAPSSQPDTQFILIAESLFRHFERSFTSRNVVKTLAKQPRGMSEKELEQEVNRQVAVSGRRELPGNVIRKVVMILMGADFVRMEDGKLRMTQVGWKLHSLLQARGHA